MDKIKNKLLQLFIDNAANKSGTYEVKASGENEVTVYLYDAIGGWFGIAATDFVKDLNAIEAGVIHLRINSPGGDVFDARAIKTALQQHPAKVIAHIDGLAASAATYIALGADEVEISQGGFFMIHQAWTLSMGNADELRETAGLLDKVDDAIVNDYRVKTGKDVVQIKDWMAAETWFSADEALEQGFVDRVFDDAKVDNRYNLAAYANVPKELLDRANKTFDASRSRERTEKRLQIIERG